MLPFHRLTPSLNFHVKFTSNLVRQPMVYLGCIEVLKIFLRQLRPLNFVVALNWFVQKSVNLLFFGGWRTESSKNLKCGRALDKSCTFHWVENEWLDRSKQLLEVYCT